MGRFLRSIIRQATGALGDAFEPRSYQLDRQGFATDAEKLRGDFTAVSRDMKGALKREQPANNRPR